ncbi:MAG: hypothetical protein JJU40_09365 [Rhodobacteraceae bacterium]|nr:hypothetical protein [Paracoccaceae bacterium]
MERTLITGAAAGLALCLSAPTALAQLTAQVIADEWLETAEVAASITVSERIEGAGVVELRGIVLEEEPARVSLDWLRFTETGDGRVEIVAHPEIVVEVVGDTPEFDRFIGTLVFSDAMTTVSGDDTLRRFDYDAAGMVFRGDAFDRDGGRMPFDFLLDIGGLSGQTSVAEMGSDRPSTTFSTNFARVSMLLDMTTPDGERTRATAEGADYRLAGTLVLPPEDEVDVMLKDGFRVALEMASGPGSSFSRIEGPWSEQEFRSSSQGGRIAFAMSADGMSGEITTRGLEIGFADDAMPMPPLEASLGEITIGFTVPLLEDDGARPFGLMLRLIDLRPDEAIFAMFDPAGMIPRDPASLALEFTGTGRWLVNIFDDLALDMSDEPAELESLALTDFRVSLGGAELRGEGRFDIDNDDRATFGGLPKPVGGVEVSAMGVLALLETLTEMGLVPLEEANQLRGGLMMFSVPEGEDSFRSRLEITPEGAVLANGVRIQ